MATRIVLASRQSLAGRLKRESTIVARRRNEMTMMMCRRPLRLQSSLISRRAGRHTLAPRQYSYLSLSTLSWNPSLSLSPDFTLPSLQPTEHAVPLALSTYNNNKERSLVQAAIQRIQSWIERLLEFLSVSARSVEVAIRMSPLCVLTPAAMLSEKFSKNDDPTTLCNVAWWYTLHVLQSLGPAFVKLAQWAATRRDIFPPNICNRLAKLHDQGYTHSWRHSENTLREAFGDDYQERGLSIHPNDIIGCGSAAQVYSGTLTTTNDDGSTTTLPVAVKILHPRFHHLVERDLTFFKSIADILNALPSDTIKMLNLPRVVDNFGVILQRQADLRVEAANLLQFDKNFASDSHISFPCPVEGWISMNVLVEEFVENAQSIADFLQDSSELGWQTRKELAGPLLNAFLKMVFWDNFTHSDLHPGNVLIQTTTETNNASDNTSWWWNRSQNDGNNTTATPETKRTIVFLDAGIATSLSLEDRRNLRDLFRAVILNNGYEAGRLMVERAKYERCSQVEGGVEAFCNGVEAIVSEFHDRRKQGLTLGAVRIGGLLSRVLDLCREHGVEIDPDMANVVISTLVLEGLGRSLHPDLNLIDCAIPFVLNSAKTLR